jgi:hypothetical protein
MNGLRGEEQSRTETGFVLIQSSPRDSYFGLVVRCQLVASCMLLSLFFPLGPTLGKDSPENPYKGQPGVKSAATHAKQKVLFTTEKKKPNKAERRAVLEDCQIPQERWKDYTVEYRVPIALGGSNAYLNIEALPKDQAKIKHKVQKELEARLGQRAISLSEAQQRILNWPNEPIAKQGLASPARIQSRRP